MLDPTSLNEERAIAEMRSLGKRPLFVCTVAHIRERI